MTEPGWSACWECRGTGVVDRARAYMSSTGEVTTMIGEARCLHCREHPGRQHSTGPPT